MCVYIHMLSQGSRCSPSYPAFYRIRLDVRLAMKLDMKIPGTEIPGKNLDARTIFSVSGLDDFHGISVVALSADDAR